MKRVVYLAATGEAPPSKTYTLLTSVHNDADDTDATDDAIDYNRVISIALLKAFSCVKKQGMSHVLPKICVLPASADAN